MQTHKTLLLSVTSDTLANYDRLPTMSRLAAWGILVSLNCVLCLRFLETRDPLLLSCDFSASIWREVFSRCQPPLTMSTDWSEFLSLLRKVAAQTVIYHIWKHRNNLIHNQNSVPPSIVFQGIHREMKNIISSRRHNKLVSLS